jgi:NodT family efflux transporter outer membrane factor (OMF) lipoprotein
MTGRVVGPDYVLPTVVTPAAYKEIDGWKVAQPKDDVLRGAWWEIFGDPQLNALEAHVSLSNQNLAQAEATYRQARALVREARASYFPTLTVGLGYTRSRDSATLDGSSRAGVSAGGTSSGPRSDFQLGLDFSWELDLWGRIHRTVESTQASAQASAGGLESARLSCQAELVQDYFQLRTSDAQKQLLDATVTAYEQTLALTKNRYASSVAAEADVVQAETQLKTAQAQAIDVGVQRAQLEHAMALLSGQSASSFSLPAAPLTATPPPIPVDVPSALLERRPGIAAIDRHAHKQGDHDQVCDIHGHAEEGHEGQHPEGCDPQGQERQPDRFEAPKVQQRHPNNRQRGVHPTTHIPLLHVVDRIKRHHRRASDIGIHAL